MTVFRFRSEVQLSEKKKGELIELINKKIVGIVCKGIIEPTSLELHFDDGTACNISTWSTYDDFGIDWEQFNQGE